MGLSHMDLLGLSFGPPLHQQQLVWFVHSLKILVLEASLLCQHRLLDAVLGHLPQELRPQPGLHGIGHVENKCHGIILLSSVHNIGG